MKYHKYTGIFLLLLSIILYAILSPFGIIYGLITNWKGTNGKLLRMAECVDRTGNVICAELFNDTMTKGSRNRFGDGRETISSVIGRNEVDGSLSKTGEWVNNVLDRIEPGHSVDNIGW